MSRAQAIFFSIQQLFSECPLSPGLRNLTENQIKINPAFLKIISKYRKELKSMITLDKPRVKHGKFK